MPRVPFRSIIQPLACPDRRAGVRLEISNQKPHDITQLGSISKISQETSISRPEHIPSYRPSKLPSCSPSHTPFSKLYINTSLSIQPTYHPYQSLIITPSNRPTPTPSHTWAILGCLGWPHRSHCTRIQGWIPLPGPVPDAVVYPVVHRG